MENMKILLLLLVKPIGEHGFRSAAKRTACYYFPSELGRVIHLITDSAVQRHRLLRDRPRTT